MATKLHNLSQYDAEQLPPAALVAEQRYAIVVADWNDNVTFPLCDGAVDALIKHGAKENRIDIEHVPGAFELTFAASRLQKTQKYDAIIVIGCVIQGDTPHFDYVCSGVTYGISLLNTSIHCPVIFSLLTTLNLQQALDRAGGVLGNKGVEGAITAIKMAKMFGEIK
ncbi:MAG: 6,7-dimethyl-8-ribityllumazine synthase [bacterium]